MSRLNDIIDNHQNLDQLFSIMKHYGVNAEYITAGLLEQFKQEAESEEEGQAEGEDSRQDLIDDLKHFYARF